MRKERSVIKESIKYPVKALRRVWMYYWNFLPVLGWIFLGGYTKDVIVTAHKGAQELPKWKLDWKTGFLFALANALWGAVIYVSGYIDWGFILGIYIALNLPVMLAKYALKNEWSHAFNFVESTKLILRNFKAYLVLWGRTIVVTLVWLLFTIPIITAIITIPSAYFSSWYLVAQFMKEAK